MENDSAIITRKGKEVNLVIALVPILFLITMLLLGLLVIPLMIHGNLNQGSVPLESIFLLAITFSTAYVVWLGFSWQEVLDSVANKIREAVPAITILFSIGVLIGAWIVSGTIPMLVYYGIKIINPKFIYVAAFCIPIIFSMLTGTSWGSAGTIGVVIMGIAIAIDANLAITAGAVVGGSYFGDKLSPLSDTTNFAAMGAGVDLYDHIKSMLYTTIPSTIIAVALYFFLGLSLGNVDTNIQTGEAAEILNNLQTIFNFNILLLLPPVIVLIGSMTRKPTAPTLIISALTATVLAFFIQRFNIIDVFTSLKSGFNINMASGYLSTLPEGKVLGLIQRGGLYGLIEGIVVAMLVFTWLGTIDLINAIPFSVNKIFSFIKGPRSLVASTLISSAATNALTSNQTANSFITGSIFRPKYDNLKIKRTVLSRSIEDTGTLLESLLPWHPTGIFMATTLGVSVGQYFQFQFLSLANIAIAFIYAFFGLFIFKEKSTEDK